jgi:hypothetical protein
MYRGQTARWAVEVAGTGKEKQKWRGLILHGGLSFRHCFGVVSSAWLVPFALAHRYVAHLPAEVRAGKEAGRLKVRQDLATAGQVSLDRFSDSRRDPEDDTIRAWTMQAQRAWAAESTDRSAELVTGRLDHMKLLSAQKPKSLRVVHTRSRTFYAAVLDPSSNTALGLPFCEASAVVSQDGTTLSRLRIPMAGVVCDNLLHYIEVRSRGEAYWMSGIFNSPVFERRVMKQARGEPPGIYTIPQKVLSELKLVFDSTNKDHIRVAQLAATLERKMGQSIRDYLGTEKGVPLPMVDDTDRGPDIPVTISSALLARLDAKAELSELNGLVGSLVARGGR